MEETTLKIAKAVMADDQLSMAEIADQLGGGTLHALPDPAGRAESVDPTGGLKPKGRAVWMHNGF